MSDSYTRSALYYDIFVEPANWVLRRIAFNLAAPASGMRVLEIGCGTGSNLALFQKAGCRIAGADLSPAMLDVARRKLGGNADLRLCSAAEMPFEDASFDLVIAFLTLHEMTPEMRDLAVVEMIRVARPDGRLLFVDFHPGPRTIPKGWLCNAVILVYEICAGREHFRNGRDFLRRGGLPAVIETYRLPVTAEKIVAGGNILLAVASPTRE